MAKVYHRFIGEVGSMTNEKDETDGEVVVAAKPGVKVYANSAGMIVVRNFSDVNRDDEDDLIYVLVHPDDVDVVAEAMKKWRETVQGKTN
jgi:hypothetical protein